MREREKEGGRERKRGEREKKYIYITLFSSYLTKWLNKPECWFRQDFPAFLRREHLKGALISNAVALLTSIRLGWKGLPGADSSLLYPFVSH